METRASGFTLIELAIVIVVIGLLIGGVLKGQELIVAARVRNLVLQQDDLKTAYFAFLDRYRAPPGDYAQANTNISGIDAATASCGSQGNGNGNHRIEKANGEHILAWEHLSKSGLINGSYRCTDNSTVDKTSTPTNDYAQYLEIVYDNNYAGGAAATHNLKSGGQIPSDLLAEADRKVDDGNALRGTFRGGLTSGSGATDPACWDVTTGDWSAQLQIKNCSAARLF